MIAREVSRKHVKARLRENDTVDPNEVWLRFQYEVARLGEPYSKVTWLSSNLIIWFPKLQLTCAHELQPVLDEASVSAYVEEYRAQYQKKINKDNKVDLSDSDEERKKKQQLLIETKPSRAHLRGQTSHAPRRKFLYQIKQYTKPSIRKKAPVDKKVRVMMQHL